MAEPSPGRARGLEILTAVRDAATREGRDDLAGRAEAGLAQLSSPELTVLVVGEFKQGKSSLVNALVNAQLSPVDDAVATTVPLRIAHAETPEALVLQADPADPDGEPLRRSVEPTEIGAWVSEATNPGNQLGVRMAEVRLPRKLLGRGLVLVDTPGVGGLASAHGRSTLAALPTAQAVLFVTDASQELTRSEIDFLARARELCPTLVVLLTKVDLHPEWRRIAELDAAHLAAAGIEAPIVPTSVPLRTEAVRRKDAEMNAESGFVEISRMLDRRVFGDGERAALLAAAHTVGTVTGQLRSTFQAEREVLRDPERARELTARLERAQADAERLKAASSRWQVTLNDGVADLTSDIDHDLRLRTRGILAEVEELIDDGDPTDMVDELPPMVERRLMEEVAANYAEFADRAARLADRVEELFAGEEARLDRDLGVSPPLHAIEEASDLTFDLPDRPGVGGALLTGMRGSYGGVLMFGMMGSMIGLATFGPITVAAGVLMGRKSVKEEKARQLTIRRQQSKAAIRKYVDDVNLRVSKHLRDSLREVQRELRDTNLARASELLTTANEALGVARQTVDADASEVQRQIEVLDKKLDQLDRIDAAAGALVGGSAS